MNTSDRLENIAKGVPTTSENLNLDKYMNVDKSYDKVRARLWGDDDFKALIHLNMRGKNKCQRVRNDGAES